MDTKLKGKTIVLTGAAEGIGRATALRLAAEGANVMLCDIDGATLDATVAELPCDHVAFFVGDVGQSEVNADLARTTVERFGAIDGAVLNVGILGAINSIWDMPVEDFDRVMSTNVRGAWLGLKFLVPEIKKQGGGAIVLTASTAGFRAGAPGRTPYVVSKHAVVGLMRAAAAECAPLGIRVNSVSPGGVNTRMSMSIKDLIGEKKAQEMLEAFEQSVPLKRIAVPEEIADAIVFLLGNGSRYCTATNLMVDGGLMG